MQFLYFFLRLASFTMAVNSVENFAFLTQHNPDKFPTNKESSPCAYYSLTALLERKKERNPDYEY